MHAAREPVPPPPRGSGARLALLALLPVLAVPACTSRVPAPPRTVPRAEALGPDRAAAYGAALLAVARRDAGAALRDLRECLAIRPPHVPSHLLAQDALLADGRPEEARATWAALAAGEPGEPALALLAARVAGGTADDRAAAYQSAAARDAASPWARIALAVARAERAAELAARGEARARDGFRDDQARLRAGARAEIERAMADADRAVALGPDLAASHATRGHVASVAARLPGAAGEEVAALRLRAVESFGRALEIDPGDPRVLHARALALRAVGNVAAAQADLDRAAAAAPHDREILRARARNLGDLDRFADAVAAWDDVLREDPGDGEAALDRAGALYRLQRLGDALEGFREARRILQAAGRPIWGALRGEATVLAQRGLDSGRAGDLAGAVAAVDAYVAAAGPDTVWASGLRILLAGDRPEEERP